MALSDYKLKTSKASTEDSFSPKEDMLYNVQLGGCSSTSKYFGK